jgi:hypothetical protein
VAIYIRVNFDRFVVLVCHASEKPCTWNTAALGRSLDGGHHGDSPTYAEASPGRMNEAELACQMVQNRATDS